MTRQEPDLDRGLRGPGYPDRAQAQVRVVRLRPRRQPDLGDRLERNTSKDAYNAAGELTSQVVPVTSSSSITTGYGYDPRATRRPVDKRQGQHHLDQLQRVEPAESVIEPTTATQTSAAGTTWTTGYDSDGRPVSVSSPAGSPGVRL